PGAGEEPSGLRSSRILAGCRRLDWIVRFVPQAAEIYAETGALASPANVDWDFGSDAVFLEDAVGGFQQLAEHATDHLRNGGVELGGAGKVQRAALHAVGAFELNQRAGNRVAQRRQRDDTASHLEVSVHDRARGFRVGGFHLMR